MSREILGTVEQLNEMSESGMEFVSVNIRIQTEQEIHVNTARKEMSEISIIS